MTVTTKQTNTPPLTKKPKDKTQEVSFKESLTNYFKGVKSEWHKITWPERQQVIHETFIVIAVTTFFTLLIYFIDIFLGYIVNLIHKITPG
jgi:preprotein translocase subunit SecE